MDKLSFRKSILASMKITYKNITVNYEIMRTGTNGGVIAWIFGIDTDVDISCCRNKTQS